MKSFIVFSAIFAVTSAASGVYFVPGADIRAYSPTFSTYSSSLLTPTQQQYHTQDDFGQYSYGYSEPLSSKQEIRSLDGVTRGSYSYRDADGKLQTVDYTADGAGFRVAATNLPRAVPAPEFPIQSETPTPVADTVEVAAAREAHFAAHQEAKLRLADSEPAAKSNIELPNDANPVELPKPVEDTVEVAAAKAEHLKKFEEEKFRNEIFAERPTEIIAAAAPVAPLAVLRAAPVAPIAPVTLPVPLAYKSPFAPTVYSYNYPYNSRFLATGYYY